MKIEHDIANCLSSDTKFKKSVFLFKQVFCEASNLFVQGTASVLNNARKCHVSKYYAQKYGRGVLEPALLIFLQITLCPLNIQKVWFDKPLAS